MKALTVSGAFFPGATPCHGCAWNISLKRLRAESSLGIRVDAFLPSRCIYVGVRIVASQLIVFNKRNAFRLPNHMATSVDVIERAEPRAVSVRWIISARDDLVWLIGSVASSYLLLVLYVRGLLPLVPMVALWAILIDAPHVFGTFSRTYFDRTERRNRGRLLWGSLLFFAVGPLMVSLGAGLIFFFVAALWAYYHLVKQHYGFMVLYKKKNNDLAPVDNALDRLLLLFAFNYPFVAFIAQDPEAMARVPVGLQNGVGVVATFLLA